VLENTTLESLQKQVMSLHQLFVKAPWEDFFNALWASNGTFLKNSLNRLSFEEMSL
jgi:hypothetical protein